MKNIEILERFGIEERVCNEIGYTASDIIRLTAMLEIEEKLLMSSTINDTHRKTPLIHPENDILFSVVEDTQGKLLDGFENQNARFNASYVIAIWRMEYYVPESLFVSYGVMKLGAIGTGSVDLKLLTITKFWLEQTLAINSQLLYDYNDISTPPIYALFVTTSLNNLGCLNAKIGDHVIALEYYKQVWLLGKKYFVSQDNPISTTIKSVLDEHVPGFTTSEDSSCSYITHRGADAEGSITLLIKHALQQNILKYIPDFVYQDKWQSKFMSYKLDSYVTPKYIEKVLKKGLKEVTPEMVQIAQMVCFEKICAAASFDQVQHTVCLQEFIKTYQNIIVKILTEHPEYCVDGRLLKVIAGIFETEHIALSSLLDPMQFIEIKITDDEYTVTGDSINIE